MYLFDNISTLLFDLDNTLLFMDENKFVIAYASNVANYFSDVIPDPKQFVQYLLEGTRFMVKTQTSVSNIDKFFTYFVPKCNGLTEEVIYKRFLDFYNNEFDNVKNIVNSDPITQKIIAKALDKGFEIVIATNPVFPEIATRKRLQWAGLGDYIDRMTLITHGEQFSTTKPSLDYYKQILGIINRKAEECLMVGNDYYNDGVASLLGMKYYHIETTDWEQGDDFLSSETKKYVDDSKIKVTQKGNLTDFLELLQH